MRWLLPALFLGATFVFGAWRAAISAERRSPHRPKNASGADGGGGFDGGWSSGSPASDGGGDAGDGGDSGGGGDGD